MLDKTVAFRHYGSPPGISGTKDEEFDQTKKSKDQVYGFILCGEFGLKIETVVDKATELWKRYPKFESPNLIVSLKDGFLQPYDSAKKQLVLSALDGDAVAFSPDAAKGMGSLVVLVNAFVRSGRTVEVDHFKRYLLPQGTTYTIRSVRPL